MKIAIFGANGQMAKKSVVVNSRKNICEEFGLL
jgi:hypothetical protein